MSGRVIAAIDLGPSTRRVLHHAGGFARLLTARLHVLYVSPDPGENDHQRVNVAEKISRCAIAEGSGLVVMGLLGGARGRPGAIATAVLKTNRAFVLAVPGVEEERHESPS